MQSNTRQERPDGDDVKTSKRFNFVQLGETTEERLTKIKQKLTNTKGHDTYPNAIERRGDIQ